MKRIIIISGVLCLLFGLSFSDAQARRVGFFVAPEFATISITESDEDLNLYSSGVGGSFGIEYSFSNKFSLVWAANFKKFTPDEEALLEEFEFDVTDEFPGATDISIGDGTLYNIIVSLQAKVKLKGPNSSFRPYLKGGIGYSLVGTDDFLFEFMDSGGNPIEESDFGVDVISTTSFLGAFGLQFKSLFVEVGIEISNFEIEADEEDFADEGGTLDLVTIPVRIGFSF